MNQKALPENFFFFALSDLSVNLQQLAAPSNTNFITYNE
jgi:hypothetical protein